MHEPAGHVASVRENYSANYFAYTLQWCICTYFQLQKFFRFTVINECIVAYSLPTSLQLSTLVEGVWTLGRIYI